MDLQYKEELSNPIKRRERIRIEQEREAANAINEELEEIEEYTQQRENKVEKEKEKKKENDKRITNEDDIDVPKKGNEKYDDMTFIPFGKEWDAQKVHNYYYYLTILDYYLLYFYYFRYWSTSQKR